MDARDYGGYQTRVRWYILILRHDLVMSRGPFRLPTKVDGARTLRQVLDPVHSIDRETVKDSRGWVEQVHPPRRSQQYRGAHADFVLPTTERKPNDYHYTVYGIDGWCQTLTTAWTVIFDSRPRVNCFRRLTSGEIAHPRV